MSEPNAPRNTTDERFDEVLALIHSAKQQAMQAVNTRLIELCWQVGAYISRKLEQAEWGDAVVSQLAEHLARTQPWVRGFTRPNLFCMRQFNETYQGDEKVSPLVRQLPWTHNLIILSQSKRPEEREFYLRMASQEKWSKRELKRQFKAALFERSVARTANTVWSLPPTSVAERPTISRKNIRRKSSRRLTTSSARKSATMTNCISSKESPSVSVARKT